MIVAFCAGKRPARGATATLIPLAVMHNRVLGLLRDGWYLVVLIIVSGAAMWIFVAPIAGIAVVVLGLLSFAYFGIVRYDDEGNERKDAG